MYGFVLGLVVALAPAPASSPPAVAIQWRGEPDARADGALHEALRARVAQREGLPVDAVLEDAWMRARVAVAYQQPVESTRLHLDTRAALDRADAAYREGRFEVAAAACEAIVEALAAAPETPGAAASAREAHLLTAKIAWAQNDPDGAQAAIAAALNLDPEARLSTREAPPALVDRYLAVQEALLEGRESSWVEPEIVWTGEGEAPTLAVEIDGVPGLRPLPPGFHFVVLHREGHAPVAQWRAAELEWPVPEMDERVPEELESALAGICEGLGLDRIWLAEGRGARVGVQLHRCGQGLGALWTGAREQLAEGLTIALADAPAGPGTASLFGPWPVVITEVVTPGPSSEPTPRPWYKKGWVWATSVGAVALISGSVAAGVLSSATPGPVPLDIDADSFIGGL